MINLTRVWAGLLLSSSKDLPPFWQPHLTSPQCNYQLATLQTEIFTPLFCNASKALAQSVVMLARFSPLLQLILLQMKQTPPSKVQRNDKTISYPFPYFIFQDVHFFTLLHLISCLVLYNVLFHSFKKFLFCLMGTIKDVPYLCNEAVSEKAPQFLTFVAH